MNLLLAALPADRLDEALEAFVEVGLRDAIVVDAETLGDVLVRRAPIFAGLQEIFGRRRGGAARLKILFVPIDDAALLADATAAIEDVLGGIDVPAAERTGFFAVLPVSDLHSFHS